MNNEKNTLQYFKDHGRLDIVEHQAKEIERLKKLHKNQQETIRGFHSVLSKHFGEMIGFPSEADKHLQKLKQEIEQLKAEILKLLRNR